MSTKVVPIKKSKNYDGTTVTSIIKSKSKGKGNQSRITIYPKHSEKKNARILDDDTSLVSIVYKSSGDNLIKGMSDSNITDIETFKQFIIDQRAEFTLRNPALASKSDEYIGAVVIQHYIANKLETLSEHKHNVDPERIKSRLKYFTSDRFISNIMRPIPDRISIRQTALDTSYTEFFNTLFNVSYTGWRDDKLSKIDNQTQCKRALGLQPSTKIADLQAKGNTICYLCNRPIFFGTGMDPMECEHILPIITALSHWWLIKSSTHSYTDKELELIKQEYDWAHRCCNQLKSNYSFIKYDTKLGRYVPNDDIINYILDQIRRSKSYDCKKIAETMATNAELLTKIRRRIQPIINGVNSNLGKMDDYGLYLLFGKCKVLSALNSADFLASIVGDGAVTEIPKSIAEKRKEVKELMQAKEEIFKKKMQDINVQGKLARVARLAARAARVAETDVLEAKKQAVILERRKIRTPLPQRRAVHGGGHKRLYIKGGMMQEVEEEGGVEGEGGVEVEEEDGGGVEGVEGGVEVEEGEWEDMEDGDEEDEEEEDEEEEEEEEDEGGEVTKEELKEIADMIDIFNKDDISYFNDYNSSVDAMIDSSLNTILQDNDVPLNWEIPEVAYDVTTSNTKFITEEPIQLPELQQTFIELFLTKTHVTFGNNNTTRTIYTQVPYVSRKQRQIARETGKMPRGYRKILNKSRRVPGLGSWRHPTLKQKNKGMHPRGVIPDREVVTRSGSGGGKYTKHKKNRKNTKNRKNRKTLKKNRKTFKKNRKTLKKNRKTLKKNRKTLKKKN